MDAWLLMLAVGCIWCVCMQHALAEAKVGVKASDFSLKI